MRGGRVFLSTRVIALAGGWRNSSRSSSSSNSTYVVVCSMQYAVICNNILYVCTYVCSDADRRAWRSRQVESTGTVLESS